MENTMVSWGQFGDDSGRSVEEKSLLFWAKSKESKWMRPGLGDREPSACNWGIHSSPSRVWYLSQKQGVGGGVKIRLRRLFVALNVEPRLRRQMVDATARVRVRVR